MELAAATATFGLHEKNGVSDALLADSGALATMSFHTVVDLDTHSKFRSKKSSCFRTWKGQSFL